MKVPAGATEILRISLAFNLRNVTAADLAAFLETATVQLEVNSTVRAEIMLQFCRMDPPLSGILHWDLQYPVKEGEEATVILTGPRIVFPEGATIHAALEFQTEVVIAVGNPKVWCRIREKKPL